MAVQHLVLDEAVLLERPAVRPEEGFAGEPGPPLPTDERVQGWLLGATAVVACLGIGLAGGMATHDRGTVAGPRVTASATATATVLQQVDPVHGAIPPGRHEVGRDIPPAHYLVVVAAGAHQCAWVVVEPRVRGVWGASRTEGTTTSAEVDLSKRGSVLTSSGCHWRRHG